MCKFLHVNAQQTQRLRDSINKYQYLNPNRAIEFGMEYVELRASIARYRNGKNIF